MVTRAPQLEWLEGDVPKATGFQDTYFSKAGGLEETRHVFLAGNGLPERLQGRENFTVAEFGFGTGLNFLTTLAALGEIKSPPELSFVSFELFPLALSQLKRALNAFPELNAYSEELLSVWQPEPGWNEIAVGSAKLVLGVGDARELISDLSSTQGEKACAPQDPIAVDAWYLDGFSPARNPELWDEGLLKAAADLTVIGGTIATYTAAGWVRRNLQAAGFQIEKKPGFAGKREMVVGLKA
ncbi:tRNA (5-methylaminomethyl-2-thiouridine)(34)-methyltransferase MnmD [uncultured Roseibium sp.]|uniref:tRNA (5-methylaminomethyl-2-thiouridine)(34)-methyltransferase MnmD n=1 Tax=uncultured Roseibium sp. TaxID=1936171 RepID=UPI00262F0A8D|nr:tRNA (5-methylaminomethyl-2-thiouridine)(34)-methyltransferase MnmD [uncultured Roseibium sp.]